MNQPSTGWGAQPRPIPPQEGVDGAGFSQPQLPMGGPPPGMPPQGPPPQGPPPQGPPPQGPPPMPTQPPSGVNPDRVVETTPPPAAEEAPSILQLLRDFADQAGCERYSADGEKIKLLVDYLWLRQLTPTLPFETFLERYAAVADFDDTNLTHPADAIKHLLPRTKKLAEEKSVQQWTAKEVVEYSTLYVDMIREAERTSQPVPLSLQDFLKHPGLIEQFRAGVFKEPAPPKKKKGRAAAKAKTQAQKERPTAPGQRTIYTTTSGRQHRGHTTAVWQEDGPAGEKSTFANFQADSGELFQGVTVDTLEITTDPPANAPSTPEGDPKQELGNARTRIPKAQQTEIDRALQSPGPLGPVALGAVIHEVSYTFPDGCYALIRVVNSEPRPSVDASLLNHKDEVIAEVQPRSNIDGLYTFDTDNGYYLLEVICADAG